MPKWAIRFLKVISVVGVVLPSYIVGLLVGLVVEGFKGGQCDADTLING